jgi:iron complex outermembrane receptor protein
MASIAANPGFIVSPAAAEQVSEGASSALEEIVVTARKRSENLQSEPLSITAFSGDMLEKLNISKVNDLLSVPNVSMIAEPGFVNTMVPVIRGIGQEDPILSVDQPVSLYVDGVLMARAVENLQDMIDPESIEILRGPQGSLFGRNTTGGAISITLPKPTDDFQASVRGGYASNNEIILRGIIDTGLLGISGLKAKLAVQRHQMDGFVRNTATSDGAHWPGSDQTNSVYFALHGDLGSVANFDYRFDYSHTLAFILSGQAIIASPAMQKYFGNSPAFGGAPFQISRTRLGALDVYPTGPLSNGHAVGNALTVNFPISDRFNIKSITAFRGYQTVTQPSTLGQGHQLGPVLDLTTGTVSIQTIAPFALSVGLVPGSAGDPSHQHQFSQELQVSGQIGRHKYVGGLYYFGEKVGESYTAFLTIIAGAAANLGLNIPNGINYVGQTQSYAGYLSDSYTPPILGDKLEVTVGIRHTNDYRSIDYLPLANRMLTTSSHYKGFAAPTGDATVKYQWTPDFLTYFRFANSYGSGGFNGRDDPASAVAYNPEYANNFEVGFKSEWLDRRVRLNADVFYTKYTDQQITTFAAGLNSNGINSSRVANAGSSDYRGTEVELQLVPTAGWDVELTFGYTDPRYKTFLYQPVAGGPTYNIANTSRFPYFSKTSASLGSGYKFAPLPIGDLSIRADYSYRSGVYFHPSDQFNALNEAIKSGPQRVLSASIDLAHIPVSSGKTNLIVSVYGKNLLNEAYETQATDYEIIPGFQNFASGMFARPRVVGINVTAKF